MRKQMFYTAPSTSTASKTEFFTSKTPLKEPTTTRENLFEEASGQSQSDSSAYIESASCSAHHREESQGISHQGRLSRRRLMSEPGRRYRKDGCKDGCMRDGPTHGAGVVGGFDCVNSLFSNVLLTKERNHLLSLPNRLTHAVPPPVCRKPSHACDGLSKLTKDWWNIQEERDGEAANPGPEDDSMPFSPTYMDDWSADHAGFGYGPGDWSGDWNEQGVDYGEPTFGERDMSEVWSEEESETEGDATDVTDCASQQFTSENSPG